jgi:hypothetical protein
MVMVWVTAKMAEGLSGPTNTGIDCDDLLHAFSDLHPCGSKNLTGVFLN